MKSLKIYCLTFITIFSISCSLTHKTKIDNQSITFRKQLTEKERLEYDYVFFNANAEAIKGNSEGAFSLFSQCIHLDPTNPTPYFEIAKIYGFKGNKEKALEYSANAAKLDPKNNWFQELYADNLVEKKQFKEAAQVFQKMIQYNPDKIELYYQLAETQIYSNQLSEAIKTYDKIEEKIGVNEEGNMQKVKLYSELKNSEKAIKELNKLIKLNPKEPKYYGMLGEIYQNAGQGAKALETFNDLLKVDPENPYVHLSLAQYYANQKQDQNMFEQYKLAFANPKLDVDTKMKVLLSYYTITEKKPEYKDQAYELCRTLITAHPEEAKVFAVYGDFLYRDKKLAEAREAFRKANARDKTKFVIWNTILFIDSELNDFDSMLADGKQTIEYFPAEPIGYLFVGFAETQKKDYPAAIAVLKQGKDYVVDNKPMLAQFYSTLGDANQYAKQFAASDSAYDKALQIDSNNVNVLNNYAYYLSLRKVSLKRAEQMSERAVKLQPTVNSYLDTYGWILFQEGNFENAKVWIYKALENGGKDNGTILEHYGDILYKLNDTDKALEYWNNAKSKGGTTDLIDRKIADRKLYE